MEVLRTGIVNMDIQDADGELVVMKLCKNNNKQIVCCLSKLISEVYNGLK